MPVLLSIDPGDVESAYTLTNNETHHIIKAAKVPNRDLFAIIDAGQYDYLAIEMIASYGMAVGQTVFETCVWIGRYEQAHRERHPLVPVERVVRREVKLHICGDSRAKDSNIAQALKDRFALGVPNHGKGTKAEPGWFYGFKADMWAAYALAVTVAENRTIVPALKLAGV